MLDMVVDYINNKRREHATEHNTVPAAGGTELKDLIFEDSLGSKFFFSISIFSLYKYR